MERLKGYLISDEVLASWEERLVPDYDLFYFKQKPIFLETEEKEVLNQQKITLDTRTSFETWGVKGDAKYLGIISNVEYLELTPEQQKEIIHEQWLLGRGLIFTESDLLELLEGLSNDEIKSSLEILKSHASVVVSDNTEVIALQGHNWRELTKAARKVLLLNYAALWTDESGILSTFSGEVQEHYSKEFPILFPYFDTYPAKSGPNCFATAISAVTHNTAYINEWMLQETFLNLLEQHNYHKVKEIEVKSSDVLVWVDHERNPVHGAFVMDQEVAFNKHGQTMFNPWQIIRTDDVIRIWNEKGFELEIYRKS